MVFNFRKQFELQSKKHDKQLKMLRAMLEDESQELLRFLVVSEPTESDIENDEFVECEEIGFATVKLSEVVKNAHTDIDRINTNVYSTKFPHESIGILELLVEGIIFMKKIAQ